MAGTSTAGRKLLDEYAKRDANAQTYLQMYDTIQTCASNPEQCAKDEAQKQLVQYLSSQTGVPVADIEQCAGDLQGCAQNAGIQLLAEQTGVSPEVINLALTCGKEGDTDKCAKAGTILVATAACSAYTAGMGTVLCTKAAPILVNLAWPGIRAVIKVATFGMGIDGVINALTFGVGMDIIMAPIKVIGKLMSAIGIGGGPPKGKFTQAQAGDVFWQYVKVVNRAKNAAIEGLWKGVEATRGRDIEYPYMDLIRADPNIRQRCVDRWVNWHAERTRLLREKDAAVAAAKKASYSTIGDMMTAYLKTENAVIAFEKHTDYLAPPWGAPPIHQEGIDIHNGLNDHLFAREVFSDFFHNTLREVGFEQKSTANWGDLDAWLTGNNWWEFGWKGMCSECTQKRIDEFVKVVNQLYVRDRLSKIEPAVVHYIDFFAKDLAEKTTKPIIIPLNALKSGATKQSLDISILRKTPVLDASVLLKKATLTPAATTPTIVDISKVLGAKNAQTIPISKLKDTSSMSPLEGAWEWAKANPDWAIPAAVAGLGFLVLAADRLVKDGFLPNQPSNPAWAPIQCPCGAETYVTGRLRTGEPKAYCFAGHFVPQRPATTFVERAPTREIYTDEPEPVVPESDLPVPYHPKVKFVPAPDPMAGWVQVRGTEFTGVLHVRPARYRKQLREKLDKYGCRTMGDKAVLHKTICRPAKPRCKWMRAVRRELCNCEAYHYIHAKGYGYCRLGMPQILGKALGVKEDEKGRLRLPSSYPPSAYSPSSSHPPPSSDDDPVPF